MSGVVFKDPETQKELEKISSYVKVLRKRAERTGDWTRYLWWRNEAFESFREFDVFSDTEAEKALEEMQTFLKEMQEAGIEPRFDKLAKMLRKFATQETKKARANFTIVISGYDPPDSNEECICGGVDSENGARFSIVCPRCDGSSWTRTIKDPEGYCQKLYHENEELKRQLKELNDHE